MKCTSGHENPDGSKFCAVCGLALAAGPSAQLYPPAGTATNAPQPYYGASPTAGLPFVAVSQTRNGFGVTAMVLGIVGLVSCYFGLILGPLAIIFGALGLKRCNSGEATNRAMALSGVILGGIATILYLLIIAAATASSGSGY